MYILLFIKNLCFIDSPHKIFIGGLPAYLNDEQVSHLSSVTPSPLFLAFWSIISRGTLGQYQYMEREEGRANKVLIFFFNFQHKFQVLFFVFSENMFLFYVLNIAV